MLQLSIMEYIKHFNLDISRQGVLWRINKGLSLPYVISYKMIGRGWVLTVET